MTVCIAS